jgi:hypothetical protein
MTEHDDDRDDQEPETRSPRDLAARIRRATTIPEPLDPDDENDPRALAARIRRYGQ